MNMSNKAESFLYRPLQHHDSFRLLKMRLRPTGDEWEATLVEDRLWLDRCIGDATKYVALSYVWGDPTFNVPNEDSIEISLSLTTALGHILYSATKAGRLNIWIDQFCINQRDEQEIGQQVNLMWRIFAGAELVIGWLGPSFKESDEALSDLVMFAGVDEAAPDEACEEEFLHVVHSRLGEDPSIDAVLSYLADVMLLGSDLRLRLLRLFSLPWFYRQWIAQEACLASNLRIWCGLRFVTGAQLFRAISGIQKIIAHGVSPWLQRPFRDAFALLSTREVVRDGFKDGSHISMAHIAATLSFLECRRDQDRINALFGIVQSSTCWFTPEYCPTPDLYIKFAVSHMQHFQSFEILHFAGVVDPNRHKLEEYGESRSMQLARPAEDLPSWVADWRIRHRQLPMLPVESNILGVRKKDSAFQVPFDAFHKTLTLKGKLLETPVKKPCGLPHLDQFVPKEHRQFQLSVDPWCNNIFVNFLHEINPSWATWYRSSKTFSDWIDSLVRTGENPCESLLPFARTLIMDGRLESSEKPDCLVPQNRTLEYFLEYAKLHLVADATAAGAAFVAMADDHSSMEKAAAYGYLAEHVCRYRTLFVCHDGVLGLGSTGISPNDRVCFFSGLKTPFVLRPEGDHFKLQGECYLDGLMDTPFEEIETAELDIILE